MADFLLAGLAGFLFAGVILIWIIALIDLVLRGDLKVWMKAAWLAGIIFFPILGALAYVVRRPMDAHWLAPRGHNDIEPHSREWQIREVETLIRLRNQGSITEAQFQTIKQRVLAPAGPQPA